MFMCDRTCDLFKVGNFNTKKVPIISCLYNVISCLW